MDEINKFKFLEFFQEFTKENGNKPSVRECAVAFKATDRMIQTLLKKEVLPHLRQMVKKYMSCKENNYIDESHISHDHTFDSEVLKHYSGREGWPSEEQKEAYWRHSRKNIYLPDTVDFLLHEEQISLNEHTESSLYHKTFVKYPNYSSGSRSFLEKISNEICKDVNTDQEKALALVNWVSQINNNPYIHRVPQLPYIYGGTEEEVIKKGQLECNEISRVLCFLCQIQGLPARCVFHMPVKEGAEGHACTEIYYDGKWHWFDQNACFGIFRPDGCFASVVEISRNLNWINELPFLGYQYTYISLFNGCLSIVPYNIDCIDHYQYTWQ